MLHALKKLSSRLIYALGVLTLLLVLYVISFYAVRNNILKPYEREHYPKSHKLRPIYGALYYPLRKFVANGSSFKSEEFDVYYGTVLSLTRRDDEPHMRDVDIDSVNGSLVMIGFTGNPSVLESFDEIQEGAYIKVLFGQALNRKYDRFINRLDSFEVIDLMEDPRMEDKEFTDEQEREISRDYFGQKGEQKICAQSFVKDYQQEVLDHCLQAGYAHNIGGGCYHLMPYWVNATVQEHAIELCAIKP